MARQNYIQHGEIKISGVCLLNVIKCLDEEGFNGIPIILKSGFLFKRRDREDSAAFLRYESGAEGSKGVVTYLDGLSEMEALLN